MKPVRSICEEIAADPEFSNEYGPIVIGNENEFDENELQDLEFDLLVRDGLVFFVAHESTIHLESSISLCKVLENSFQAAFNHQQQQFTIRVDREMPFDELPDIFGCTRIQSRRADVACIVSDRGVFRRALMVAEVTFRGSSFQNALAIATSYLMPWTNIAYALAVFLHEYEAGEGIGIESIQYIMMRRPDPVQALTDARYPDARDCRAVPMELKDRNLQDEEISQLLGVDVVENITIRREDINGPRERFVLNVPVEEIVNLNGLPIGLFNENGNVQIDLRPHSIETFQLSDALVAAETFPRIPRTFL